MSTRHIPHAIIAAAPETQGISAATPLLLVPVHIQTRFVSGENGSPQLWVRIYPDQISVNSHEAQLTSQEIADGQAYWNSLWEAGNPPPAIDSAKAPWRTLASLYTPQRAAWIALQLTPTNLSQQPAAPTRAGATPVPAPTFPNPPKRASSWEQPAVADALPDAWSVVLVSGGQTSVYRGSPIATPLNVSLTPNGTGFPTGMPVDAGLQWMVDFPTAVAAGMALSIPLTAAQQATGFDQIFVYGLRTSDKTPAQTWVNLLSAHHYTDGLSFLPQGSPTNNTPDATSAYSRKDPDYEISFATERQGPLTGNANCDGTGFASYTGAPATTFDHVRYANGTGTLNSTDMLQALWPATLGYFLSQFMSNVFTPALIEQGRQYAIANVHARGPVVAFSTGTTAYGVLPVTSLANYAVTGNAAGPVEPGLVNFVRQLWPTWLSSSASAPHMQSGGDPDQNLMSVLGMDASSMNFQGRAVIGPSFLWNFLNFLSIPAASEGQWWQNLFAPARALLNSMGYSSWNPGFLGFGFSGTSFPVTFPTVQTAPLSETQPLALDATLSNGQKQSYITWLQTAAIADIQAENYPGTKPTSLLYKILRQSVLLLYAQLAGAAEVQAGTLTTAQLQETELIGIQPSGTTLTPWQLLIRPAIPNPKLAWADHLLTASFPTSSPFAPLNDFRASLGRLANLPTAELDRLLTETLDACSHRLDVWATGIATAILNRTRATNNAIGLGCYGWVENVRPETGRAPVAGSELQAVQQLDAMRAKATGQTTAAKLPVPLQPLTDNGGYIYAPSAAQAAVGAVLRNGYLTHQNTAEEGLLAIDLSSERVSRALSLINGVQQGQSLNALLGYLFEDALSTAGLQKYIQPFRNAYPVVGPKLTPSSAPAEAIAASNVVDGLALRTAWDNGQLPAGGNWGTGLPAPGPDQNSVITILQMIDDYADALGDLSMAEAVFQIIRGNFGRGSGLMTAISQGAWPPAPDVVDTPAGGIDLTHRVAVLFAGGVTVSSPWSAIPMHSRAAAEPWLNAWLSQILPDPSTVRCQVQYQDSGSNAQTATIALSALEVGPLDLLYLSSAGQSPQRSELENRILYAAALPAGSQNVQIVYQAGGLPAGSLLFPDVLYVAQTLRTMIGATRALEPQDMTPPETDAASAGGSINMSDLQARATAAVNSLTTDLAVLTGANTDAARRTALLQCSFYGVPGSIPLTTSGADPLLSQQQANVSDALQQRLTKAASVTIATSTASDLQAIFQTIFGSDFVALPKFTPPNLATLQSAFTQSAALVSSDPQAPARWFRQCTYTHSGVSRLDFALSAAQAVSATRLYPPTLTLAQVPPPTTPPDQWLALPINPAKPPQKGRVALNCILSGNPTSANTYAGLLIEEWLERIPDTQASTAVAFHFQEPSARAPNALLLAVCPRAQDYWDDTILQAILSETLELAKIRTVDLASVGAVGQILPALYFALNLQGATISTQFAVLKEAVN